MFQLKRYVLEETHIVDYMELEIEQNFSCLEKLVAIFDNRERERETEKQSDSTCVHFMELSFYSRFDLGARRQNSSLVSVFLRLKV